MTAGLATADATASGTNETAGARQIAAAFATANERGRAACPVRRRRLPRRRDQLRGRSRRDRCRRRPPELGLPYSDPLADGATLQRASQVALRNGATLDGSLTLIERIAQARPAIPVVPMGYAGQFIGGGDGREARRLANAGAAGVIVDLTPDEEARSRWSPATSTSRWSTWWRRRHPVTGGRDRPTERRLPVLRLARRGNRRSRRASDDGRSAGPGRGGRLAGPGRGRVRGEPAGPCPGLARAGAGGVIVSRRPWSTHWATMAATWIAWLAWSETSPLQRDAAHEGPCLH